MLRARECGRVHHLPTWWVSTAYTLAAYTLARGPIERRAGPVLEALDILVVLQRDAAALLDLQEKASLAARLLELTGTVHPLEAIALRALRTERGTACPGPCI